ncbi:Berardinelli-Seip congenital lipodystrophy 2 (seipin) [Linnemannia schmuckeri]|uniref:Berardinelli-Seip congenital lipodystrophy 2 (Seipin) n=1 Tax=Linnemannia schmuckeri TaxID=64567 RepID=A0A9P5S3T8_9FUNG|nr:Berardinelli-Seip congenital lipodystrophy 2 (seipin) [Linnemannia schmuckeri]
MTLFEILQFFITPLLSLLEPYVQQVIQWLTSSALHRKVIKFFIGLTVLLFLVGVSLAAYLSFYWIYIPQRGHVGQVHLQYDRPTVPGVIGHGPSAEIDFTRGGRYDQFLRGDQAYDISLNLHVPTSEKNVAIGNFMVVVTLLRADGKTIMTSSRPGILTYHSAPLKLMKTAWKAVPLVLDWSKEDQIIKLPLIENYVEDSSNPVARAFVEISTPDLQVYKSSIHIDAHFHGLRQISTALVFMAVFIFWEIIFSVVTWQVLASWFGSDSEALIIAHQIRPHSDARGQLRSPTLAGALDTGAEYDAVSGPPRQPQLQGEHNESDSEFEEEYVPSRGKKQTTSFDHDEMEDDDDEQEQDQHLRHAPQGPSSSFPDDAVVPERPSTPGQRQQQQQQQLRGSSSTTTITPTITTPQQRNNTFMTNDDDTSTAGSTTSSRRTGRSGMDFSMTTSSSFQPPPPPPPSILSERSSEFQMSRSDNRRRTAVESEYTEEDDEYLEGGEDDDEEDDDGNVTFGEDDFSEAALLSRSPPGSGSLRSRRNQTSRGGGNRESAGTGVGAGSGRSSGRAGP